MSQTSNSIAAINPYRYRGYRYDGETRLYYLQSRYYDPVTCWFVNADGYASTGHGIVGHNMYAYCNNNPVNCSDPTGNRAMGPSFMLVNDGGGGSGVIGADGEDEKDLLSYHADNSLDKDETLDANSTLATCYQTENYIRTESQNILEALGLGGAASFAVTPITNKFAKVIDSKAAYGFNFIVGVVTSAVSYATNKNIPAGEYKQYVVVTTERYYCRSSEENERHVWRITTRSSYYIDKAIGIGHQWVYVGGLSSERWVDIP